MKGRRRILYFLNFATLYPNGCTIGICKKDHIKMTINSIQCVEVDWNKKNVFLYSKKEGTHSPTLFPNKKKHSDQKLRSKTVTEKNIYRFSVK